MLGLAGCTGHSNSYRWSIVESILIGMYKWRGYCEIYESSKVKMAGTFKGNGSGSNDEKDDGRKTVHMQKKRKTSFEMDG
jgi:hypothetical protein